VDPFAKLRGNTRPSSNPQRGLPAKKALRTGGKNAKLDKFATFLEPKTEEELSSSRLRMMRAGYRGRDAVRKFHAIQFILGILFLIIGVVYAIVASATGEVSTTTLVLAVIAPGAIGYYLPVYWIERRVQTRQEEVQNGFPDALDMLLVCVEAGQSLDQGIIRVSKELKLGYPALAEEFEIVAQEVKAGKDKTSVLRAFSERTGVADIASFVTVMIQSQTFGTSIAEALRVYAGEMRDKRVMRAEEAANKLPTKMTLGTMMFTVPPLLVILVGPSVYDMLQLFKNFRL
jgi:tight adherence protein C